MTLAVIGLVLASQAVLALESQVQGSHDMVLGDPVAIHGYDAYHGVNCFQGHGAMDIDKTGTSSPPRNLSLSDCLSWCTNTSMLSLCPRACTAVEFHLNSNGVGGTCWRRANVVLDECVNSTSTPGSNAYTLYLRDNYTACPSPPSPAPYPPPPPVPPANGGRNVLYIVYDDLRPDLSAYDVPFMKTPSIQKLADTGVTFTRAYVQEAVCSPSRNSFTTGRRPNSTKVWNFINHFRNAECETRNTMRAIGTTMPGGWTGTVSLTEWTQTATGGHAQCCTSCTATDGCVGWTYDRNNCTLMAKITGWEACPNGQPNESQFTCVGGMSGYYPQWTPLPANFRQHGYLTLGVGKYYHPGGHSAGGAPGDSVHPSGPGTPPLADRYESWSYAGPNGTIQFPDQNVYAQKWGRVPSPFGNFQYLNPDDEACGGDYCHPDFAVDGDPGSPPKPGVQPLADFVTYNDAITKMQFASANKRATGQPFFLVTGIKRPHLNWRTPPAYADMYPVENVSVPTQLTLDRSINPIAYTVFPMSAPNGTEPGNFVKSPYTHGTDAQLRELRGAYYAAVSWADFATGRILDELDRLDLTSDTLVVLHSDHGWHLGEYAMWEKRSNWELATRVPLIMRAPWIPDSVGKRSNALVELVDLYPTICDLIGIALPNDTVPFDGVSLRRIVENPQTAVVKSFALSSFPRCAHIGMPIYGARGTANGADNTCLDVERTDFTWMGYTMRTDRYRYTEWVRWNGSSLSPLWHQLEASELYDHLNDTGAWTDADRFENVNLVTTTEPSVVKALSKQLHAAFGFPDD